MSCVTEKGAKTISTYLFEIALTVQMRDKIYEQIAIDKMEFVSLKSCQKNYNVGYWNGNPNGII